MVVTFVSDYHLDADHVVFKCYTRFRFDLHYFGQSEFLN